jgi:translation elongation factor aEF-1 beta
MAQVIVTLKIMPTAPEVDLNKIKEEAKNKITDFAGAGDMKIEEKPIAFGLKSLNIIFVMDESKGSTDALEDLISEIKGVQSVEVTDVRRAIG